jgi:hypothetical protein
VWAQSLCETIDAMMLEYQWRLSRESGEGGLPSYEDYVLTGRYSIGVPPHVWATVIASNDPSAVNHLGYLSAIEETASRCIRLANDLQSYQKEIREGKINALVILGKTARLDNPQGAEVQLFAEERVRADIALGLKAIDELQAESRTDTGRPEAAIADIARFVCDFYGEHDYHTFLAQGG